MASATSELIADIASGNEPRNDLAELMPSFRWHRFSK